MTLGGTSVLIAERLRCRCGPRSRGNALIFHLESRLGVANAGRCSHRCRLETSTNFKSFIWNSSRR